VADQTKWFTSSSGRIEIQMTLEQAQSASHQGRCDDDVLALSKVPEIAAQLEAIKPGILAAELKQYGAWDDNELADHQQNIQRILWLAAGDIVETEEIHNG
jgi:folate-binding Fe-S cluster repair protein YgfZ